MPKLRWGMIVVIAQNWNLHKRCVPSYVAHARAHVVSALQLRDAVSQNRATSITDLSVHQGHVHSVLIIGKNSHATNAKKPFQILLTKNGPMGHTSERMVLRRRHGTSNELRVQLVTSWFL